MLRERRENRTAEEPPGGRKRGISVGISGAHPLSAAEYIYRGLRFGTAWLVRVSGVYPFIYGTRGRTRSATAAPLQPHLLFLSLRPATMNFRTRAVKTSKPDRIAANFPQSDDPAGKFNPT